MEVIHRDRLLRLAGEYAEELLHITEVLEQLIVDTQAIDLLQGHRHFVPFDWRYPGKHTFFQELVYYGIECKPGVSVRLNPRPDIEADVYEWLIDLK